MIQKAPTKKAVRMSAPTGPYANKVLIGPAVVDQTEPGQESQASNKVRAGDETDPGHQSQEQVNPIGPAVNKVSAGQAVQEGIKE